MSEGEMEGLIGGWMVQGGMALRLPLGDFHVKPLKPHGNYKPVDPIVFDLVKWEKEQASEQAKKALAASTTSPLSCHRGQQRSGSWQTPAGDY